MKIKCITPMNVSKFLLPQFFTKIIPICVFFGLVLFSSCKESTVEITEPIGKSPENGYEALSQTLSLVNNKIKSQRQANELLMTKMAQINDPNIRQACAIMTQNSLFNEYFVADARARTNGEVMNLEEINKDLNSSTISSKVREKIFNFGKELEKTKEDAAKKNINADKEISEKIANMEKSVNSDTDLKAEEKIMLLGITQVLKNNYQDIKKSAEQAVANGRTSCWLCWVVNAVVTVVVVAVVVAVVSIATLAALTSGNDPSSSDNNAILLIGGGMGVVAGVVAVVTGNCFTVIDYGQTSSSVNYGWFHLASC